MRNDTLARQIGKLLATKKLTISVCESCTAGMLGAAFTSISGSSKYFQGGFIAYSDTVKKKIVGVKARTLEHFGAVSAESASEMALGVKKKIKSDIGIAVSGIAGPGGGSKEKPIGTVYIAVAMKKTVTVKRFLFKGRRQTIRRSACKHALELLREELRNV
jgi:nicotinamide-nucleotide amidase